MGFWGVELMTRAGVDPAGSDEVESWGGEEDWRYEGLNGWQIVRIVQADAPSADQVLAASREIGGPLLVAYLIDSDCAAVTCAEPEGEVFEFYVHPETAVGGYELPRMDAAQEAAPQRLVGWAGEGAGADVAEVRGTRHEVRVRRRRYGPVGRRSWRDPVVECPGPDVRRRGYLALRRRRVDLAVARSRSAGAGSTSAASASPLRPRLMVMRHDRRIDHPRADICFWPPIVRYA
jgi:hypothetical protein